jgi:CSLREA domain-containing protein
MVLLKCGSDIAEELRNDRLSSGVGLALTGADAQRAAAHDLEESTMKKRFVLRSAVASFTVAASFMLSAPAHAAVAGFTVNVTTDAPDATVGDGWCKTSTGKCSLRAAVQEANALARAGNTISLPANTYTLSVTGAGEDMAATGDLDIRANITFMGTPGQTTILGGTGFGDRIFDIPAGLAPVVTLNGLIVRSGSTQGVENGGGIQVHGGSVKAISVTFRDNRAGGSGGGWYQDAGTLTMSMSSFTGNTAAANGGGLDLEGTVIASTFHHLTVTGNTAFQGGGLAAFVTPTATGSIPMMYQSTFTGNSTTAGGFGGGMAVSRMTATVITVSGNTAAYGGGVEMIGSDMPAFLASRFYAISNTATVNGGGIFTTNCAVSCGSIMHARVESNTAYQEGSGLYINDRLVIEKSTINLNQTRGDGVYGGAVYHAGTKPLTLTNLTIGENTSGPAASGLVVDSSAVDVINKVTIAENRGGSMANGVFVTPSATPPQLLNTIVSTLPVGGVLMCNRPVASQGYNLESNNSCGFNQAGDLTSRDPLLHPLADNGGGTYTMKPGGASPTADAGDPSLCPVTDQRSVRSPVDYDGNGSKICDIGSYENGVSTINSDIGFTYATPTVTGLTLKYTLGLKSGGAGSGANSIVTDVLPSSLTGPITCTSDTGGLCEVIGNTVKVTFVTLGIGQVPKITITALIATPGLITDTAVVWSENPDWFPYDNTITASITV